MDKERLAKATYDILTSKQLTYRQKLIQLARQAEDSLDVLDIPEKFENQSFM